MIISSHFPSLSHTHTHTQSFNHIVQMLSSSDNSQAKHIKRKRDEFRKLLSGIIGVGLILYIILYNKVIILTETIGSTS